MTIAVLAWGSLIWDRRDLAIASEFMQRGPILPVEFARISGDGRLTLVIDEAFGASCSTYYALSACSDLNAALENLWTREGSGTEVLPKNVRSHGRVGWIDSTNGTRSEKAMERHPQTVEAITVWMQANGYDAVIWTALGENFHEPDKAAEPFSEEAAIRYLASLKEQKLAAALRYIRFAPPDLQTPVRAAVNARWPEG
ncbi:hypothetical protein [Rhizobium sp. NLR22b]|uniref:hypothetical protein n=1 Tax=Rhizobium sp. NLR22b TaxID=2731115 RepID=UPI001C831FD1|nr:hypothetical protein [Rhizobium sp. NLR22b]MBX5242711.1 hypothetical protein [Rhizobium sp. NLR22b]